MKVFIAEDSTYVCELLAEMLSEVPGVRVVGRTKDALLATQAIRRLQPDAVILDIGLTRGSGLGVLATIKKDKTAPLVIVLSGQGGADYRRTCMDLGADYFFEKTDGFQKVVEVLQKLIVTEGGASENTAESRGT